MRKLLRAMAKAEMTRKGYSKVNRRMAMGHWHQIVNAYPGFRGRAKQRKGSNQPILHY